MTKRLIQQLHREIAEIESGKTMPGRVWAVKPDGKGGFTRQRLSAKAFQRARKASAEKDVAATRRRLGLSQNRFARLLGISVRTLHHWEQGRRKPSGAACVLLRVAARHPEVVLEAAA